jgi:hypothetical protein
MKLSEPVAGIQFFAADQFLCTSGSMVRFFKLKREADVWMEFSSPLTSLEPLQAGLMLATFADSSVRLVWHHQAELRSVIWKHTTRMKLLLLLLTYYLLFSAPVILMCCCLCCVALYRSCCTWHALCSSMFTLLRLYHLAHCRVL